MHFHREDIFTGFEVGDINEVGEINLAIPARVTLLGVARRTNGADLHVTSEQFLSVKIDNSAIIPQKTYKQWLVYMLF